MLQFSNDDIIQITKEGITFKTPNGDMQVTFSECKYNYAFENSLSESNCVATHDVTVPVFTFYSNPKVEVLFKKKNFLQDLFSKRPWHAKFFELQKTIQKLGYTTYDLS